MKKKDKIYKPIESLPHKVNVFHVISSYRFFHISCDNCKLKTQCEPIQHKNKTCKIASEARELLTNYTVGYVASFASDDFYIQSDKQKPNVRPIILYLLEKYTSKIK